MTTHTKIDVPGSIDVTIGLLESMRDLPGTSDGGPFCMVPYEQLADLTQTSRLAMVDLGYDEAAPMPLDRPGWDTDLAAWMTDARPVIDDWITHLKTVREKVG